MKTSRSVMHDLPDESPGFRHPKRQHKKLSIRMTVLSSLDVSTNLTKISLFSQGWVVQGLHDIAGTSAV